MVPAIRSALGALYLISLLATSHGLVIENRQNGLTIATDLPSGWTFQGCYVDVGRTLTQDGYDDDIGMTQESCITYCSNHGYIYAGVEYSAQCYCGNTLAAGAGPALSSSCNMGCSGNPAEACGGPSRLNLFWSGAAGPSYNPGPPNWSFSGCYAEGTTGRALPNGVTTTGGSDLMTVALCTQACQAAGYVLAGAEYSGECWCGDAIVNGGILAPDGLAGCDMLCNGNFSEFCGGPSRLNVYDYQNKVALPPWTTISSTSTSSSSQTGASSSQASTSSSFSSSTTSSFSSASTTSSDPVSTASSTGVSSSVTTTSPSSSASSSTVVSSPVITTSSSSSASASPTLGITPTLGAYVFIGCYTEATTQRALSSKSSYDYPAMTLEECYNDCLGYTYFGVEYGGECYCGNTINLGSVPAALTDCSFICPGNQYEYCGAGNRLNMYKLVTTISSLTSSTSTSLATSQSSSSSGISTSSSSVSSGVSSSSSSTLSSTSAIISSSSVSSGVSSSSSSTSGIISSSSVSSGVSSSSSSTLSSASGSTSSSSVSSKVTTTSSSSSTSASPTLGITQTLGAYVFIGCYTEATAQRALSSKSSYDYPAMTLEECYNDCLGYTYFGVEYGGECYCGNTINLGSVPAAVTDCSFICPGNQYEYCGAGNRLNMYKLVTTISSLTSSTSTSLATSQSSSSSGISTSSSSVSSGVSSSSSSSTLSSTSGSISSSSVSSGVSSSSSSTLSSTTSSSSSLTTSSSFSTSSSSIPSSSSISSSSSVTSSSILTSTSTSSSATASPTLGIKQSIGPYTFQGCYTEATNQRALSLKSSYDYLAMTLEECYNNCLGYTYFGVEYGGECYCGNSLNAGSVPAASTECSFTCPGNQYEYCGAGNRLELYMLNGIIPTSTAGSTSISSTTATSTSISSTTAASISITTPTATGFPANWAYYGCYIDGVNGRILNHQEPDSALNTPQLCVQTCASLGYTIAAVEYGEECYCDNAIYNGGALAANQADCNEACPGNSLEDCGAGNRMNLYSIGTPLAYQPPGPQTYGLPANWKYVGCLQDNIPAVEDPDEIIATFPYMVWNSADANTPTACITVCQQFGFNAAGLEYGSECFCGDVENIQVASAPGVNTDPTQPQFYTRSAIPQIVPDSECNSVCSGATQYLCGSGNLLTYYTWDGPEPLYEWSFPTGIDAGEYSLLIGGVVVPLMTAQNINGKVSFVEKSGGTGEPNGTGAYELDLTEINNWDLAWRQMTGLQTDVFCSAGLILPDLAGRQLTVGGWAGQSNFGVRLYWPDGSAGIQGTNEWVEDPEALQLQVPRWYPSAMIMANGSILVVGGEIGSNDAEQPTLEILPATGVPDAGTSSGYSNTTVYLDFLQETAPFNLYPFICVVPSGIFIAYYNQARILDEVTFQTIKQLPQMPGAVNDPTGGRNYQLQGTMVLLPQHYPFTDDLTVLICGGSTQNGGYSIDNCISTQPEAANPEWTIERMPSRRVMPCMAGLPDGTYIILNGAQHGVAGFGLAGDPNYNAILYDPTQSVNQRMSVMANTTVARLYHSEAITLLDGRVLVSGSDPTGDYGATPAGEFPEEYRVEVFTPPYLLNGAPRPIFDIEDKDWAYNGYYTFTVTSGTTSGLVVSLLGSVVSTHGNSMGQRTLFPFVVCAGNTCEVNAPPDPHTAPPGWYMMFILNGPTPSVGQYVRIGGDPASLGNWPNLPPFDLPGVNNPTA